MTSRGQLVVLAAGVIAAALVPIVVAYLQLGYAPAAAGSGDVDAASDAHRVLTRDLRAAAADARRSYPWPARGAAVVAVRENLSDAVTAVERSGGGVREVSYDASAARRLAREECPRGPDRAFGPCRARRGVVVQNRTNQTHVVAAVLDLRVTAAERRTAVTLAVRPRPPGARA